MGCWHGHGCGPAHCGPAPRGWYGPSDEYESYEDVSLAPRRRARERPADRDMQASALEAQFEDLRDQLRRVEAALENLTRPSSGGGTG